MIMLKTNFGCCKQGCCFCSNQILMTSLFEIIEHLALFIGIISKANMLDK